MRSLEPEWSDFVSRLEQGAKAMGADLDPSQMGQFVVHARELLEWNRFANLTAIIDAEEMAEKHFLDTVPLVPLICQNARVLDIGAGGGFPGIPLKVLRPDLRVTLIEAARKKTNFLKHIIRTLGLRDVEVHQVRAEELGKGGHDKAGAYGVIVSKGVSRLEKLLDLALPLLGRPGIIIAMKGMSVEEEVTTIEGKMKKEGLVLQMERYRLPALGIERTLVILRREKA